MVERSAAFARRAAEAIAAFDGHLLGIDHTKLTYRFSGRDMRLTDVHGEVIKDILDSVK